MSSAAGRAHEFATLFDGERPAFPAVPVATHGAAMLALEGIFAALLEREHTGRGQPIETSLLRALSVFDLMRWAPGADRALRVGDVPMLIYTVARTRDGVWLQFSQNSPGLFRAFLRGLELEHVLDQEPFRTAPHIADPDDARALRAILLDRVGERSWDEWQVIFAEDPDVSAEPFAWPGDALAHPQLLHTGDSIEVDDATLGPTRQLGPLFTASAKPTTGSTAAPPASASLLQGTTVLELATWIATPMATALLAELGARVIKIEPLEGDPLRGYGPVGLKCVQGKESITLDLKTTEGRDIVHRLVERADALVHNYRPGVPERLGIDDATLRAAQPGADLRVRRVLRLDRTDVEETGVSRDGGSDLWWRLGAIRRRRHTRSRRRALRRGAGTVVAAPHAMQRGQPRLQRRARRRGRGDDGVVRACPNRRRPDDGDPDDGVQCLRAVGTLHRLPGPAAAGLPGRGSPRTARALPAVSRPRTAGSSSPRPTTATSHASAKHSADPRLAQDPRFNTRRGARAARR